MRRYSRHAKILPGALLFSSLCIFLFSGFSLTRCCFGSRTVRKRRNRSVGWSGKCLSWLPLLWGRCVARMPLTLTLVLFPSLGHGLESTMPPVSQGPSVAWAVGMSAWLCYSSFHSFLLFFQWNYWPVPTGISHWRSLPLVAPGVQPGLWLPWKLAGWRGPWLPTFKLWSIGPFGLKLLHLENAWKSA